MMDKTEHLTNKTDRDCSHDTDKVKKDGCSYVEPLPESSRPRRDGPGGN
ncbi:MULTISPECIES: hypothetical protein [Clostridia]|uniref:Uncharacterized protein n=2 Tax=Enterocloster citroniae TaxID=358743 RepID=A0AA41KA11_9FIRM|nr:MULTISPECIES: hypothetical protein [Clostridia]MBT9813039.1 hypothetical protein [Enterocloster citroniae]MCB7063371.1 hypothetical protein [Enterocloster citroniae]MCC8083610.1 hypothetical protein [Clostridium sp.]